MVHFWQSLMNEVVSLQASGQIAEAHIFFQGDAHVFGFSLIVHGLEPP
jgi:hypothetical protein